MGRSIVLFIHLKLLQICQHNFFWIYRQEDYISCFILAMWILKKNCGAQWPECCFLDHPYNTQLWRDGVNWNLQLFHSHPPLAPWGLYRAKTDTYSNLWFPSFVSCLDVLCVLYLMTLKQIANAYVFNDSVPYYIGSPKFTWSVW